MLKYYVKFFSKNKNYYKILGIENNANKEEIKKAFVKLAKIYHPDKNENSKDKFTEINELL